MSEDLISAVEEARREIVRLLEQVRPPLSREAIEAQSNAILAHFESSDNGGG